MQHGALSSAAGWQVAQGAGPLAVSLAGEGRLQQEAGQGESKQQKAGEQGATAEARRQAYRVKKAVSHSFRPRFANAIAAITWSSVFCMKSASSGCAPYEYGK